jgi:hypothetical protein
VLVCPENPIKKLALGNTESKPVIDRTRDRLYLVSMSAPHAHTLYAIDITSGEIVNQKIIQGNVPGRGDGGDRVWFDGSRQKNRTGLLLQRDTIYVGFGGIFEQFPYHGWVFAFNADTLNQVGTYATNPDGTGAGIWQSGNGLTGDGSAIYVTTGNGLRLGVGDGQAHGPGYIAGDLYGSSVVKLTSDLNVADSFVPSNQQCLDTCDLDLSTSGAVLLPSLRPGLPGLITGGKEGRIYLLDSSKLGSQLSGCPGRTSTERRGEHEHHARTEAGPSDQSAGHRRS